MEYDNQACATDESVSDSGNVDTPQQSPIVIERPSSPNGSVFAQWFKAVDPNARILEDSYFGPSGWALESDNFADDRALDDYLKVDHVLAANESSDPFNLTLDGFASDEEGSEVSSDSDLSNGLLEPLGMVPLESDWSKMPPLLPALSEEKPTGLEVLNLERQMSDWSKMPDPLPPIQLETSLPVPQMAPRTSDYMYVVPQVQVAQPPPQIDWNANTLVDVQDLSHSVVPYPSQSFVPAFFPGAQASGLGQHNGQMVYHLPFIVLGSTQL